MRNLTPLPPFPEGNGGDKTDTNIRKETVFFSA